MSNERLVLSTGEAAEALGVSEPLIRQWLDAGHLPEITRVSRRRLIPRRAVEQLVEAAMDGWDPAEAARQISETGLRSVS